MLGTAVVVSSICYYVELPFYNAVVVARVIVLCLPRVLRIQCQ